jgi:hypothetical protein
MRSGQTKKDSIVRNDERKGSKPKGAVTRRVRRSRDSTTGQRGVGRSAIVRHARPRARSSLTESRGLNEADFLGSIASTFARTLETVGGGKRLQCSSTEKRLAGGRFVRIVKTSGRPSNQPAAWPSAARQQRAPKMWLRTPELRTGPVQKQERLWRNWLKRLKSLCDDLMIFP